MSDWSHGYNVSLGYTYGFYREMTPDWMDTAARIAGYVAPSRDPSGAFRYLELGSGQGYGLCLLAAANPDGEFVGIDFNPEHIAHSTELAAAGGLTNIRFLEADFTELGKDWPADLGQFDYIAMHGICSWVPYPVRVGIVQCMDKALKPGALVYNSYNTQPGWLGSQPFQHLARRLEVTRALPGPQALDQALALFDRLAEGDSSIFKALPTLKNRLESVRSQNRAYLVQEYLHENWSLFWFSDMMREMSEAKLGYVGSATLSEQLLPGLLSEKIRKLVEEQTDPIFRQELIDTTINQAFRRDVMCRGPRRAFGTNFDGIAKTVLQLITTPTEDVQVQTSFGSLSLKLDAISPIIDALNGGPKTIGELMAVPAISSQTVNTAIQSMILLIQAGTIAIGRANAPNPAIAHRMNAAVARGVAGAAPYNHIAAATLGSAVPLSDVDLLLLDAWNEMPKPDVDSLSAGLNVRLAALGRGLAHEGKRLQGEALAQRGRDLATTFIESAAPRLRKIGAIA